METAGSPAPPPGGRLIALTGATGYVGGELLQALLARGERVRCLVRDPATLHGSLPDGVQIVQADLLDAAGLPAALSGADTAYYLVHSMRGRRDFAEADREAAHNFSAAARAAGIRRIIYLGALARSTPAVSSHLASRLEVGEILRASGVPVVEFRASIVLGPGSLSFETMRALVERLPVMITPRWVRMPCQPIAADDLLAYLVAALDMPAGESAVVEIGGADAVSYGELMGEYARQRGLLRLIVPVPVLTPWLSSLWLGLVTPVQAPVGRRLIEGLSAPTVVMDGSAPDRFGVEPRTVAEAIRWTLAEESRRVEQSDWETLMPQGVCKRRSTQCPARQPRGEGRGCQRRTLTCTDGHLLLESRSVEGACDPPRAFDAMRAIGAQDDRRRGGTTGRVRGPLGRLLGGPGFARDRDGTHELREGDLLDNWRVVLVEPGRRVRLRCETAIPGRAWLEFKVTGDNPCTIHQTVLFDPRGLSGIVFWYATAPLRSWMLRRTLLRLARRASEGDRGEQD